MNLTDRQGEIFILQLFYKKLASQIFSLKSGQRVSGLQSAPFFEDGNACINIVCLPNRVNYKWVIHCRKDAND